MFLYLVPLFSLQVAAYAVVLFALWISTKPSERTTSFRILATIVFCVAVGSALRGLGLYLFSDLTSYPMNAGESIGTGGFIATLGLLVVSFGFFLKPLFFRSLRQSLKRKNVFYFVLGWFITAAPIGMTVIRFGLGPEVGIVTSVVLVVISSWGLLELKGARAAEEIVVRLLRLALVFLIAVQCYFGGYSLIYLFELNIALDHNDFIRADFLLRSARISLFFVIDVLCFFYWLQWYSTSAIRAAENRKKIELALIEKDLLIKNLINANALIQTGAVTAGLSHEINQFLARIQLDVDSAKVQLANRGVENVLTILNRVLAANSGAALLVQNMKKLFVKQDEQLNQCDIDSLIQSVAQLYLTRTKLSKIVLTVDLHANTQVFIRETLMRQVVSNLIANAIDALDSIKRSDKKITLETAIDGDRWLLRVIDNAHGVRPENAHKIFSLFSTSKSEGTGIGLWLSRYIVEQHDGYLRFSNLETEGVMFWLEMPIRPSLSTDPRRSSDLLLSQGST